MLCFLGELDCQDASDELAELNLERSCSYEKGVECDEHICEHRGHLPCGDGRCTLSYIAYRLAMTEVLSEATLTFACNTLRDLAFQCELHEPLAFWTLADGFCISMPGPWSGAISMAPKEQCEFWLKCWLSYGLSTNCPTVITLLGLLSIRCKSNLERIKYPPGSLFGPRTYTYYKTDRPLLDRSLPDYVIINGELRCPGFHLTFNEYGFSLDDWPYSIGHMSISYFVEWILCTSRENSSTGTQLIRNYSSLAPHLNTWCWHKWLSLFNLPSVAEVVTLCTHICLSLHRVHDGVSNCIETSLDEETLVLPVEHPKKHCLNCITYTKEAICLPTHKINSYQSICVQGEDRYMASIDVAIKNVKCTNSDTFGCRILRDYIDHFSSSRENVTVTTSIGHTSKFFPFGQYCDTYFDTETGIDESVEHCLNKWICAKNEYRCLTGQCIPFDWLCDGKQSSVLVTVLD